MRLFIFKEAPVFTNFNRLDTRSLDDILNRIVPEVESCGTVTKVPSMQWMANLLFSSASIHLESYESATMHLDRGRNNAVKNLLL